MFQHSRCESHILHMYSSNQNSSTFHAWRVQGLKFHEKYSNGSSDTAEKVHIFPSTVPSLLTNHNQTSIDCSTTWKVWGVNFQENPSSESQDTTKNVPCSPRKVFFLVMAQNQNNIVGSACVGVQGNDRTEKSFSWKVCHSTSKVSLNIDLSQVYQGFRACEESVTYAVSGKSLQLKPRYSWKSNFSSK